MDLKDKIEKIIQIETNVIKEAAKQIIKYCEEDESIKEFVEIITDTKEYGESFYEYKRSFLNMVLYKLGYQFHINEFHDTDSLSNLASFIGNYCYDDAYYVIYDDDYFYGGIKHPDNDDEKQLQGVEHLLRLAEKKAKREIERFNKLRNLLNNEEK